MSFRRTIQIISMLIFLLLITAAVSSSLYFVNPDIFLRMDPIIMVGTAISGRIFSLAFIPALIVLLLVPLLGRVFCGYICPMGTTIDVGDRLSGAHAKNKARKERLRKIKYYLLFFLLGSSLLGVSLVFVGSPISLITRFYGLLVYPVIALLGHMGLRIIQPLAEQLDLDAFIFASFATPRFATQLFILLFFVALFAFAKFSPRFWCRYICPSGALMSLFSRKPFFRRRVSDDCTNCGECVRTCPMNAIRQDMPEVACHEECIVCRKCESVCPVNAVSFAHQATAQTSEEQRFLPARRQFMVAGLAGFGTAAVSLSGLNSLYGKPGVGQVTPPELVRPPGAMPEKEFLSMCVRCGECMIACPKNALQPIWIKAGFAGLFSPALVPRRGACSPECNNCGAICPTGAIRNLPIQERLWAKLGTAVILREKCLAWEHQKRCMVCDEVCPFGAVRFRYEPGNPVPVPEVFEDRCSGCGHCEHHCPVQNQAAIIVAPMGALRLSEGSFKEQGERQGLKISLKHKEEMDQSTNQEGPAPGFDGPAPGFTE
ncbi:4Fe-4S binding protein [Thermodesulfobacteriota bacterium]